MFTTYDIIIVGGGVAGLSAGIYAGRSGLNSVVFDKQSLGGELVNRQLIENYPGFAEGIQGPELAEAMTDQAANAGCELSVSEIKEIKKLGDIFTVVTEDDVLTCKSVILATGAHPRLLNVPGEKELFHKGVIYCATCDGGQVKGKPIVIAGAGDSGLTEALYLEKFGCKITVLEFLETPKASQIMLDRANESENIEVICSARIAEITGDGWVDGIVYEDRKTGEMKKLDVQGVVVRIGMVPSTEIIKGVAELAGNSQAIVDDCMETSVKGLFAAGDIRFHSPMQFGAAAGDGINAGMAAIRYINSMQ